MDVQVDAGSTAVDQGAGAVVDTTASTAAAVIVGGEGGTTNDPVETQQVDDGTQERGADGKFKPKAGVQNRIDELTRARHEADREAAYWRSLAQNNGTAQPSAQAATTKPTVDQFDDYAEFVEALTDWKTEQAVAKRMAEDSNRKVTEVRAQTFQERQNAFAQVTPDYAEVIGNSNAPIAKHVIEAAQESDVGPQLLYHFAQNPDVLDRINRMDERSANREIGRLEATLGTPKATAATPAAPTKITTKAPAPAGTSGTQGRATTPDLANASMDEYMAQRKSQGARWAR